MFFEHLTFLLPHKGRVCQFSDFSSPSVDFVSLPVEARNLKNKEEPYDS